MYAFEPQIYVACLASYNNSILYGVWIDATQDPADMYEEIKNMLAASPIPNAEEWELHDFDDFGDITLKEFYGLEMISDIAQFIALHGELGANLIVASGNDIRDASRYMRDCYVGEYDSEEDFAISYANDCMEIAKNLEYYIDYKLLARDLLCNDYFSVEACGKIHIFTHE